MQSCGQIMSDCGRHLSLRSCRDQQLLHEHALFLRQQRAFLAERLSTNGPKDGARVLPHDRFKLREHTGHTTAALVF